MSRLVYNRIGKAGSTALTALIYLLSKTNRFHIQQEYNFYPSKEYLWTTLINLPNDTVYINHCHYIDHLPADIQWMNVMRDPIDREQSTYYYDVSADLRGGKAKEVLDVRSRDLLCGCGYLEFDDCVRIRAANNCTKKLKMISQNRYFCEPKEVCTPQLAFQRARDKFTFVGMSEEMDLTVRALEQLLPRFFKGAHKEYVKMTGDLAMLPPSSQYHHNTTTSTLSSCCRPTCTSTARIDCFSWYCKTAYHTPSINTLTNTSKNGCVSDVSTKILTLHNADETELYRYVYRLFWYKIAHLLPVEAFTNYPIPI